MLHQCRTMIDGIESFIVWISSNMSRGLPIPVQIYLCLICSIYFHTAILILYSNGRILIVSYCIASWSLNENIFAMDWGPTVESYLQTWTDDLMKHGTGCIEWFIFPWIHQWNDSSTTGFSVCPPNHEWRMTFATSTRRWLLKWRMSGIQVPKRNLQTLPWNFRCRCFSKHSNSVNE